MKLKIEKVHANKVRIEFSTDRTKAPFVQELDAAQLATLVNLLATAQRADQFTFQLDL
jgi:hypothetical protein